MQTRHMKPSALPLFFILASTAATATQCQADSFKRSREESKKHFPEYRGMSLEMRIAKNDLTGNNIAADRQLSAADRTYILSLSDYLIDKRNQDTDRGYAAKLLGKFGHSFGIPSLIAVLRDDKENMEVQRDAVTALSKIKDKRVVGYLIEDGLGSDHVEVASQASDDLAQLVGGPLAQIPGVVQGVPKDLNDPDLEPPNYSEYREGRQKEYQKMYREYLHNLYEHRQNVWRAWWTKNRANISVEDLNRAERWAY